MEKIRHSSVKHINKQRNINPMKDLIFVTGNEHKLTEARAILNFQIESSPLDLDEIQSIQIEDVIEDKAKRAYEILKRPLIVEDVGLYIEQWDNFPGALIKWVNKHLGAKFIASKLDVDKTRNVIAKCGIGYHDGEKVHTFIGEVKGTIAKEPQGESGFGFDPIFIAEGYDKSMAELGKDEKNKISWRALAFNKLKEFFENQ